MLLVLCSIDILIAQTVSKTINITPTTTQAVQQVSYVAPSWQTFTKAGYDQNTTINGFTQYWYQVLYKFNHPNFTNSDITKVVVKYNARAYRSDPAIIGIVAPKQDCGSTPASIASCTDEAWYIDGGVAIPLDNSTHAYSVEIPRSFTSNGTTYNVALSIFGTGNEIRIVFKSWETFAGYVDLSNVSLAITYNCTPPTAPTSLTATVVSTSQIDLSWPAVSGAIGYEIYSCTGTTPLYTNTSTSKSITGLLPGTSKSYRVKAINSCGSSISYSPCASATTFIGGIPDVFYDNVTTNSLYLNYRKVSNATGYSIYDCQGNLIKNTFTPIDNFNIITEINNLEPGKEYCFKVKATNSSQIIAESGNITCYTRCNAPNGLQITNISSTTATLTWSPVVGAKSYHIYKCNTTTNPINANTNSYNYAYLYASTNYCFNIAAVNFEDLESSKSDDKSFTTNGCEPTMIPTIIEAIPLSSSSISLYWSSMGQIGASSYDIYTCSGVFVKNIDYPAYTITGLSQLTNYSYKVKVSNCNTDFSACVNATTKISEPSNFTVTGISTSEIQLSWSSVSGASQYELYSCGGTLIASLSGTSYTHSSLASGSNYSYKVRTIGSSSTSNFTSCKDAFTNPAIPSGLTANATSSSSIALSWNAVSGASSYDIYSCSGVFIANSTGNSFTVTGLTPLINYSYKVVAKNSSGSSGYSSCADATTKISDPTNLVVTALPNSEILISWNGVSGATQYEVYTCNGNFVASTAQTSYSVKGLVGGTNYSYKVRATCSSSISSFTACSSATAILGTPNIYFQEWGFDGLILSWDDVPNAISYEVYNCAGYLLGTTNHGAWLTFTNLVPGEGIYAKVRAIYSNSSYNSAFSECIAGFASQTSAPSLLINNTVFNYTQKYIASIITVSGNTSIEPYYAVVLESDNQIVLNPGFHAKNGCFFQATISTNPQNINSENPITESEFKSNNKEFNFSVYPNPTKGSIKIMLINSGENVYSVEVLNILGVVLKKASISGSASELNISDFRPGSYFIKIISGNNVKTKMIIKE